MKRLLVLVVAIASLANANAVDEKIAASSPNLSVLDYQFVDESGRKVRLGDVEARIIVLNLWATWCGPCREELPSLQSLQKQFPPEDVRVVTVSQDRAGQVVVPAFFDRNGIKGLPQYTDPTQEGMRVFVAPVLPTTLIISHEDGLLEKVVGLRKWDEEPFVSWLEQTLAAMKTQPHAGSSEPNRDSPTKIWPDSTGTAHQE